MLTLLLLLLSSVLQDVHLVLILPPPPATLPEASHGLDVDTLRHDRAKDRLLLRLVDLELAQSVPREPLRVARVPVVALCQVVALAGCLDNIPVDETSPRAAHEDDLEGLKLVRHRKDHVTNVLGEGGAPYGTLGLSDCVEPSTGCPRGDNLSEPTLWGRLDGLGSYAHGPHCRAAAVALGAVEHAVTEPTLAAGHDDKVPGLKAQLEVAGKGKDNPMQVRGAGCRPDLFHLLLRQNVS